jgi:hypothetical protein
MAKQNKNAPKATQREELQVSEEPNAAEAETSTPTSEFVKTLFTRPEKEALIEQYKGTQEKMKLLEAQMDELREQKSDVAFELQKAFGEKKFKIDGVLCRVVKHTGRGSKKTVWYLKGIDTNVEEEF